MSLEHPISTDQPSLGPEPHEVHAPSYGRDTFVLEARTVVRADREIHVKGMTGRMWIWIKKHPLLEVEVGDTVLGLWGARRVAGTITVATLECYDSSCRRPVAPNNIPGQPELPHFEVFRGQPLPGVLEKLEQARNARDTCPTCSARPTS